MLPPDGSGASLALRGVGPRPVAVDISGLGTSGRDADAVQAAGDAAFAASVDATGDPMNDAECKREMARVQRRPGGACCAARALTVWSSTQQTSLLQAVIAHVFDIPQASVRVIKPFVGSP